MLENNVGNVHPCMARSPTYREYASVFQHNKANNKVTYNELVTGTGKNKTGFVKIRLTL
jgi:hypothetical protein